MRDVVVKGKQWSFQVKPKKTIITGPKGRFSVLNEIIATGPITPGKVQNYIREKILNV